AGQFKLRANLALQTFRPDLAGIAPRYDLVRELGGEVAGQAVYEFLYFFRPKFALGGSQYMLLYGAFVEQSPDGFQLVRVFSSLHPSRLLFDSRNASLDIPDLVELYVSLRGGKYLR